MGRWSVPVKRWRHMSSESPSGGRRLSSQADVFLRAGMPLTISDKEITPVHQTLAPAEGKGQSDRVARLLTDPMPW